MDRKDATRLKSRRALQDPGLKLTRSERISVRGGIEDLK